MAEPNQTTPSGKENITFLLAFILKSFADIQDFLAHKQVQALLNDEDQLNATLKQLDVNEEQSKALKLKLQAMIPLER